MTNWSCKVKLKLSKGIVDGVYLLKTETDDPFKIERLNQNNISYPAKFIIDGDEVLLNRDDIEEMTMGAITILGR
ncbi:hypothetical protein PN398_07355 [Romboutsia sp. 1001216sp1]|uniref:hypothetical protein n=1 Tax=Romboutsia sp. 1001216sp1 TaxID=2986997 RepID=UPI00232F8A6B|nr:hypothetical protein [Romboutsia sp. 1001216sp1]MDB8790533.1 hypothetical protein [Romboutsia sp. 1001216sp1]